MTNQVPSIIEVFVNWFPMLLLIGVWIFFMRSYIGGGKLSARQYQEQCLQEQKRHNEALEEILARLEHRLPQ